MRFNTRETWKPETKLPLFPVTTLRTGMKRSKEWSHKMQRLYTNTAIDLLLGGIKKTPYVEKEGSKPMINNG